MFRKDPIVTSHIYHIFNRGVNKGDIFFTDEDYSRFLNVAIHYKTSSIKFSDSFPDTVSGKSGKSSFGESSRVKVLAYCLMPNHFHLLIKQLVEGGITSYMRHLANSYSHYVNIKYKREGPLFQGRFKNVLIESDEQLVHVSRYIHLNPLVSNLVTDLKNFKWSSYLDYISDNKSDFCDTDLVLGYFKSKQDYEHFVLDQADYGKELERIKHLTFDSE